MKFWKMAASAALVVSTVLGTGWVGAGSAAAATGSWVAYKKSPFEVGTSTWHCGQTWPVGSNLLAQVCVVRTADEHYAQSAVIVRNNNSFLVGMTAQSDLSRGDEFVDRWSCASSGVAANSWSVCFGATGNYWAYYVKARGDANLVSLPESPWA
ncbi:hypothetical protein [Umezawaea tangerina]|uniref:Secreted protein n=1 Tax=Umezawaea tangerina TaxID=84725 RepID=A0A2T0SZV3_9PSEU|nr:hypothetical protein [Umezawaea tangerina]PRY38924.1 hypothetical protein CLV43_108324 [Umezawaea tangerina]